MPLFGPPNVEKLKAKGDIKGLINALADGEHHTRIMARDALVIIGASAVEPLIVALQQQQPPVRRNAALVLGIIGDRRAAEALIRTLEDRDLSVLRNAVLGISLFRDPRAVGPLINVLAYNQRVWPVEYDQYEYQFPQLEVDSVHDRARQALIDIGAPAVERLIASLRHDQVLVRRAAAWALGDIADPRAVEPLIVAMRDTDEIVRANAADSLGQIGDARAATVLIQALGDSYEPAQRNAVSALARIRLDIQTQNALIAALNDPDSGVRRHNARIALGRIRLSTQTQLDPQSQSALFSLLQHTDEGIREFAVQKLDELGWKPDGGEMGARYWARKGQWDQCIHIGTPAVEALLAELSVKPDRNNIKTLARIGDARAIQPLIDICTRIYDSSRDLDKETLKTVATALGGFGTSVIDPILQAIQPDMYTDIKTVLLSSLGYITDAQAVEGLSAILIQKKPGGEYAACALGEIGDARAVEALVIVLQDTSRHHEVHTAVAKALGKIGDARGVEPLITTLEFCKGELPYYLELARTAILSLARTGDRRACAPIIDYLIQSVAPDYPWRQYRRDLQILFSDYTWLITDLIGFTMQYHPASESQYRDYEEELERFPVHGDEYRNPPVGTNHCVIDENLKALSQLFKINTPVSNNLLHGVKSFPSESKHLYTPLENYAFEASFDRLRKIADEELERRGNPLYDPSIYLDAEAWKVSTCLNVLESTIACPDCGNPVSDSAVRCRKCGHRFG